jgi:hypothetical protein
LPGSIALRIDARPHLAGPASVSPKPLPFILGNHSSQLEFLEKRCTGRGDRTCAWPPGWARDGSQRRRRASADQQCPGAVVGDLGAICAVNSGAGSRRHQRALSRSEYFGDLPPRSDVADCRGHSVGSHEPTVGFQRNAVHKTPMAPHTRGGPNSQSGSLRTPRSVSAGQTQAARSRRGGARPPSRLRGRESVW